MVALLGYLPRGNTLGEPSWRRRHLFLQGLLLAHLPGLLAFGLARGFAAVDMAKALAAPAVLLVLGRLLRAHRPAALAVTAGLVYCSAALVVLSDGAMEAHFHFFVMIGFIALYQDWLPFVWNAVFTVVSHGVGSWLWPGRVFGPESGQQHPWTWSLLHGAAVLAACVGTIIFWRSTENEQRRGMELRSQLSESNRRRFTADLLVNLARRNQNLIYRQLDLLNRLEEHERDAGQLSHLFQLDHLATRMRRNAESLLVLSGEEPARKWGRAVLLVDVVRAAIAEIEELDRVDFAVDESLAVSGRAVADCTHLLAELVENAVHFSPPGVSVMIRTRPYLPQPGAQVLTVEDWGVGMAQTDLAAANELLHQPREVDLSSSQRLGLLVVARLAQRYRISVTLESTPGGGVTAVTVLPAALFVDRGTPEGRAGTPAAGGGRRAPAVAGFGSRTTRALPPTNGHGPHGSGGYGSTANGHGPDSAPAEDGTDSAGGSGREGTSENWPAGNGVPGSGESPNGPTADLPTLDGHALDGHALDGHALDGHTLDRPGRSVGGETARPSTVDGSTAGGPTAGGSTAGPGIGPAPGGPPVEGRGPGGGSTPTLPTPPTPPAAPAEPGARPTTDPNGWPDRMPAPRTDGRRTPAEDADWRSWWTAPVDGSTLDEATAAPPVPPVPPVPPAPPVRRARPDPLVDPLEELHEIGALGDLSGLGALAGGLARRTPQASLADQLRRPEGATATTATTATEAPVPEPGRTRDPLQAHSALSRFQANQRAARELADGEDRP